MLFIYFPSTIERLVSRKNDIIGRAGCYLSGLKLMHITQGMVEHGHLKCTGHPLIPNFVNLVVHVFSHSRTLAFLIEIKIPDLVFSRTLKCLGSLR